MADSRERGKVKMKTISEIKEEFAGLDIIKYQEFRNRYQEDSRAGVQKLIEQSYKKEAALEAEKLRTEQMKVYEHKYEDLGYLCGIVKWAEVLCRSCGSRTVILPKDARFCT